MSDYEFKVVMFTEGEEQSSERFERESEAIAYRDGFLSGANAYGAGSVVGKIAEVKKRRQSPKPEEKPNPWIPEDEWEESERVCEKCGLLMWSAPWWDDPEEHGGACIGTQFECGGCGDTDNW